MKSFYLKNFDTSYFWTSCPLFFAACFLLFGISYAMTGEIIFLLMGLLGALPLLFGKSWTYLYIALGLLSLGFFHGSHRIAQLPREKLLVGKGELIIESLSPVTPKKNVWVYHGKLRSFESNGITYKNIPCQFTYMGYKNRPQGNHSYAMEGTLIKKRENIYFFKQDKKKPLSPLHKGYNLSEIRYKAKDAVQRYIKKKIHHPSSASFINALLTGNSEDRYLRYSFGKLGLQHIMAISGFHFSLFVYFFSTALFLFPAKRKSLFLLLLVNSYFLFLGNSPSITRAYISIQLALLALLLGRRYSPINALGAGLLLEMILDPLALWNLGLQLSYLACGAIFLLYPFIEKKVRCFFPIRPKEALDALSPLGKIIHSFSTSLRMTLSLSIGINFVLLPILLYQFHLFPLMSLFYNLFIPLFVSGCLFFTMASIGISLILPPLSKPLFFLVSSMTSFCLDFVFTSPACLQFTLRMSGISFSNVIFIVCSLFFLAIAKNASLKYEKSFSLTF